mgnify:FL=1
MTNRAMLTCVAVVALAAVVAAQGGQGRQGQGGQRGQGGRGGGPPGVFFTDVPAHEIDVVLARPTSTSMTASVLASRDMAATISCEPACGDHALTLKAGVPTEVVLSGLAPNRDYRYTVTSGTPRFSGAFHTARPSGAPFTFAVQADSHLDNNTDGRVYENTLANMRADRADFLVDLGDTFMTDKYPKYQDAAKQYVAQRYYFGLLGTAMPVFLTLGNHDGETGTRPDMTSWASAMRTKYFPPILSDAFYSAGPASSDYYTWTWGDARFIVLDPFNPTTVKPREDADGWAWTLGRAQYDWLTKTLETSRSKYTFVFIHHLVGGSTREGRGGAEASVFFEWGGRNLDGSQGFATHRAGWAMPIHELLLKHHVSAVFHGHDHLYVRQQRDGLLYMEVPQPSHARGDQINSAREYGYLSGTLLGSSGHIRVSVGADNTAVDYVKSRLTGKNAEVVDHVALSSGGGAR